MECENAQPANVRLRRPRTDFSPIRQRSSRLTRGLNPKLNGSEKKETRGGGTAPYQKKENSVEVSACTAITNGRPQIERQLRMYPSISQVSPTAIYRYVDKVQIWLREDLPRGQLAYLRSHCGGVHSKRKRARFNPTSYVRFLVLRQPSPHALDFITRIPDAHQDRNSRSSIAVLLLPLRVVSDAGIRFNTLAFKKRWCLHLTFGPGGYRGFCKPWCFDLSVKPRAACEPWPSLATQRMADRGGRFD